MLNRRKFIASSALTAVGTYLFSKNTDGKQIFMVKGKTVVNENAETEDDARRINKNSL
jgi:hypothetical protein